MKKRLLFIDILRLIAIFGVVLIHVSAENMVGSKITMNMLANNFMNALVHSFSVPMFVTISGYLLINRKFTYSKMMKKYLLRIFVCLVFWHCFYYLFHVRCLSISSFIDALKALIIGNTYSHLWYLYLVIGLYLLTPIFAKLVVGLSKRDFEYILCFGFFITSLIPTFNHFISFDLNRLILPYKVFNFNIFIFYYLLGYYLRKYGFKYYKTLLVISIFMLFFMAGYSNYVSIQSGVLINYLDYSNIIGLLVVISLFCFFKYKFNNVSNKFVDKLGRLTFGVYLVHFAIEKVLLYFKISSNIIFPVFGNIVVTLLILVISYVVCYILSKIPFVKKIIL